MKTIFLTLFFACLAISSVSFAKSASKNGSQVKVKDGDVSLQGTKASEMIELMKSVGAIEGDESKLCGGMGGCNANGKLKVVCQFSNDSSESGSPPRCVVASYESTSKGSVTLEGNKAKKMMTLLDSAHASSTDDSCGAGTCYQSGALSLSCDYPNGANEEKEFNCNIAAAKVKKSSAERSPEVKSISSGQ